MLIYFLLVIPPFLLGLYAQWKVKSAFAAMSKIPARMSGATAARKMLDASGLQSVTIEQVAGQLSDHYDPRAKVLRLSSDVYNGHSMASLRRLSRGRTRVPRCPGVCPLGDSQLGGSGGEFR